MMRQQSTEWKHSEYEDLETQMELSSETCVKFKGNLSSYVSKGASIDWVKRSSCDINLLNY